jgi:sodium-dependent dicarboxylate transporter 2/3/5
MDWATLVLIAGGIALGALLEASGLVAAAAERLPFDGTGPVLRLLILCLISASLSALMSNTATATFVIPLALSVDPSPSTAIVIAVACSLGVPFVISTPPNAMAVGRGLPSRDLLLPGLVLMIGGCVAIALTGPWVLRVMGVR